MEIISDPRPSEPRYHDRDKQREMREIREKNENECKKETKTARKKITWRVPWAIR